MPGSASYPPRRLRVVQQVENIVHEIILMWIELVMQASFQTLLEDGDHIRAIGCRYELQRAANLFKELVSAIDGLLLQVDLVSNADAGNVRALVSHLSVPVAQISIGDLACDVENHDAYVGAEVVRRVKLIERLLTCSIPDVYSKERKLGMMLNKVTGCFNLPTLYVFLFIV